MENIIIKKLDKNGDIPFHLLLLADPSKKLIEEYISTGDIRGVYLDKNLVGVYVLVKKNFETLEIINIAVDGKYQGRGIGKMMIMNAIQQAKLQNVKKLEIGTGNSSIYQLALYQKCGFKIESIDKGFFQKKYNEIITENGIVCVDMIRLGMNIG